MLLFKMFTIELHIKLCKLLISFDESCIIIMYMYVYLGRFEVKACQNSASEGVLWKEYQSITIILI